MPFRVPRRCWTPGFLAAAALLIAGCAPPPAAWSPRNWPPCELQKYAAMNRTFGVSKPAVSGAHWMISGTTGPLAIHAGAELLRRGGSAMDAALATAMGQIVLSGGSWNSFAGLLYVVYFDAKTGRVHALNAGYDIPAGETEPLTIPKSGTPSGRTALVPGFMAGVEAAHRRFGRVPFRQLFDPAIDLAESGIEIDLALAKLTSMRKDVLSRLPATAAVYLKPDGSLYAQGETLRQPALARTLRNVASSGAKHMYDGAFAAKLVDAVRGEGGKLTLDDLRRYRAEWTEPLTTDYRGYVVHAIPPPEVGSVQLVEALNLIEASDLRALGRATESAAALHRFIQICRLGYVYSHNPAYQPMAGRDNTSCGVAPYGRVTKQAAAANWRRLQRPGWELAAFMNPASQPMHSDGVVAVDRDGNAVALLHSSNTNSWGTTGINIDGVSIPDSACIQQPMIAKAGPGQRLPNITNPTIILSGGRLALAASSIGSSLHECMLQNLVRILDFGVDPQVSVDGPTFGSPVFIDENGGSDGYARQSFLKGQFSAEILAELKRLGQDYQEFPDRTALGMIHYWVGIRRAADGRLSGGVSSGLNGIVEAE